MALLATIHLSAAACDRVLAQERQPAAMRPINVAFVRYGFGAWTARLADGGFDTATGRTIRWSAHDTDSAVIAALAGGRFDIGLMGASVLAAAVARGIDLKAFYVLGAAPDSEALLATRASGIGPADVKSLHGKVIAVPFGSSSHFRLLESLHRWGIGPASARIVNLQTGQIADAWDRGEIDAAVVAEPLLSRIEATGQRVPMPPPPGHTGALVFAGHGEFIAHHLVFLARFIDVVARSDMALRAASGQLSTESAAVLSIAATTALQPAAVLALLERYRPPPLEAQASQKWLAGGPQAGLLTDLKESVDIWRWAGRLAGADADLQGALTPGPVQQALGYQR